MLGNEPYTGVPAYSLDVAGMMEPFMHSFIHSFIHLQQAHIHSFIQPFIHSFNCNLVTFIHSIATCSGFELLDAEYSIQDANQLCVSPQVVLKL